MPTPVVIVHYHLNRGGVTKVIETQVSALEAAGTPYLILTGQEYSGGRGLRQHIIPELNYLSSAENIKAETEALFVKCIEAVTTWFGQEPVLWHFHNPTLGKNILFPGLIELLSESQERLLFLCHDFSEDGRPGNFQLTGKTTKTYPIASNIHYAFINTRDRNRLETAGIPSSQLHYLPNATLPIEHKHTVDYHKPPVVLYPARGIRRKNIGELLLWSILAPEGTQFALTQAPLNPEWKETYKIWEDLAGELDLSVKLGCIGQASAPGQTGSSYKDWLASATHCISTSVAEGFGLTFLEPLTMHLPLIGRNLAEVTKELKIADLPSVNLYEKILINLDEIDADMLKAFLKNGLSANYRAYETLLTEEQIQSAWDTLTKGGVVDFGNLPEKLQIYLLIRAKIDGFRGFQLLLANGETVDAQKWIATQLAPSLTGNIVPKTTLSPYTLSSYQARFTYLLASISQSPQNAPTWLDRKRVLAQFLKPERFNFLQS